MCVVVRKCLRSGTLILYLFLTMNILCLGTALQTINHGTIVISTSKLHPALQISEIVRGENHWNMEQDVNQSCGSGKFIPNPTFEKLRFRFRFWIRLLTCNVLVPVPDPIPELFIDSNQFSKNIFLNLPFSLEQKQHCCIATFQKSEL